MLDITEMMYESLDALTNNSSTPTTPTTPTTSTAPISPLTPLTPITPITPIIPIHYNPSKTSMSAPSSPSYYQYETSNRRHFKIIGGDIPSNRNRHISQISFSSTSSSSDFSTITINTLNSTSSSPTLHNEVGTNFDDSDFEKLINFDHNDNYHNEVEFDVIINVGQEPYIKRFRSHSVILSERSSYFRTAFSENCVKKHDDIYLFDKPNMSPKVFTAILRYLYFGTVKLERLRDISTLLDLLIASDELSLEDFTNEIQTYFIHLNSDWLKTKIIPILQCCYSNQLSFPKLMLHTLTIIKKDPTSLLIQSDIHLLSKRNLNNVLNECYTRLEDWAIWQCILKWALGQEKINEFSHDVKKWKQNEFIMLHELIFELVENYVRFSHISRNYFLDKVLPYLNYWIRDVGLEVAEEDDANKETILYYLSHSHHYTMHNHHHHHITHHKNINHHASSSSSSTNIILEDSALINHIHALKITHWIQEGNFIPKVIDNTSISSKSKKCNSYRFIFPFFKKRNRQQQQQQQHSSFISNALTISTHILTTTTTKSYYTKAQLNEQSNVSIPTGYQFNLLFRMTRDGASAYHDKCMNQGPTLVLTQIKLPSPSQNNRYIILGGYNPIGFNYFPNSNCENNSYCALTFTFGDGKSFEKGDVIKMMINDEENFKSTPTTTSLSMKRPRKELFPTKVNNLSINNNHNNGLCFGNDLIINFHDKSVEFNGGQNFGIIKSDIIECEIFQVKELCY